MSKNFKKFLKFLKYICILFLCFIVLNFFTLITYGLVIWPTYGKFYKEENILNANQEYLEESYKDMPSKKVFGKYYIDDVYIEAFVRGESQTRSTGDGPYNVYMNANADTEEYQSIIINGIKINSTLNKKYGIINNLSFPIKYEYEKRTVYNPYRKSDGSYGYKLTEVEPGYINYKLGPLDLSFWRGENIIIEYDITVIKKDGTQFRDKKVFKFKPYFKKDLFQFQTA